MIKKILSNLLIPYIIVNSIIYFYFYSKLPSTVPIHFNINGVSDSFGDKSIYLYLYIFILTVLLLVYLLLKYKKQIIYKDIFNTLLFMVLLINLFIIYFVYNYTVNNISVFNMLDLIMFFVATTFLLLSRTFTNIKINSYVGIKTPWTLKDEYTWNKTHSFSKKLWFILCLIIMISTIFSEVVTVTVSVTSIFLLVLIPLIYSYVIYKRKSN